MKYRNFFIFIAAVILVVIIHYWENLDFTDNKILYWPISCLNSTTKSVIEKAAERKYITCSVYEAGGFGNQIWRFASLYGLGRFTGREPYFEIHPFQNAFTKTDLHLMDLSEIGQIFPLMHDLLHIKTPPPWLGRGVDFAPNCCKFDNPKKLLGISERYLKITGDYLQSYKFFHSYRNEIKQIFECGPAIAASLKTFTNELFQNDSNFKLCVHIRRGDFLHDILLESKEEFVVPTIEFAYRHLVEEGHKNISLLFIGNDLPFVKGLKIDNVGFNKIYMPDSKSRGEDMCLGINYCDSMIMTASGSTFSWWMAYLMKSNGTIFYNSQTTDPGNESKDIHDFDLFLPEWIKLTAKNGTVIKETQWWHQRNNVPPDLP